MDAVTQGLTAIRERSDTQPTFEHNEKITIADFSGSYWEEAHDRAYSCRFFSQKIFTM